MKEMVVSLLPDIEEEEVAGFSGTQCKRLLGSVYIHISDYVEGRYDRTEEAASPEEHAQVCRHLRVRIREVGPFPREQARTDGLRALLRTLFRNRIFN